MAGPSVKKVAVYSNTLRDNGGATVPKTDKERKGENDEFLPAEYPIKAQVSGEKKVFIQTRRDN